MSDDETAPEMLTRLGTNAMLWAQEFNKTAVKLGYSEMDEGWLIGWFANAIENCDVIRCNQLRADLAAVTAERDRLRDVLKPFASPPLYVFDRPLKYVPAPMTEDWIGGGWFSTEDFRRARAALEGVTEPPR